MTEDESKDPVARYCGLPPLQKYTKSSTKVLFVNQLSEVSGIPLSSLLSFIFMPLPFKSPDGIVFFAAITKQQVTDLDALIPTQSSMMTFKQFDQVLFQMIEKWIQQFCGDLYIFCYLFSLTDYCFYLLQI